VDEVEEGAQHVDLVELPGQGRGEVEAEAVDVHLLHPVAEGVHHELQHVGDGRVEGVPRAREVHVVTRVLRLLVVGGVVEAPVGERRPEVVALAGVVVDDVDDDLEAGRVERPDHHLHLADRVLAGSGGVGGLRREVGEGVVAPVVPEAPLHEVPVVDERLDRLELERGHAEGDQVVDHRLAGEAEVGAAQLRGHVRVTHRRSADVGLVDDGLGPGDPRMAVVAPVEALLDHHPEGGTGRAVLPRGDEVRVGAAADLVAEERVVPAELPPDGLGVGVEEHAPRVEAMAVRRRVGAVHPVGVELARPDAVQVGVPHRPGALLEAHAARRAPVRGLPEQQQLDGLGVLGEHREVHPRPVPGGAERVGEPRSSGLHSMRSRKTAASGGRVRTRL
jgi:hypothetical protein